MEFALDVRVVILETQFHRPQANQMSGVEGNFFRLLITVVVTVYKIKSKEHI